MVFKKVVLGVLIGCLIGNPLWAAENRGFEARVVGGSFKTLAKGYVATVDIERLKASEISRIQKMKEDRFARRYARAYAILRKLPAPMLAKYEVTEGMTKAQAVSLIRSLDKKQLNAIIEGVPDTVIAEQFNAELHKGGQAAGEGLQDKIAGMWGKAVASLNGTRSPRKY